MSATSSTSVSLSNESASSHSSVARLNIFALPSRTTLLFALIVLVIALPILASFGGGSPICAPFLLFWMILLPVRDFLRRPNQTIQSHSMKDASKQFPSLSQCWNELAINLVKIKPPRLMLTQQSIDVFTFGSFRRRYAALSEITARALEQNLASSQKKDAQRGQAILLHELAHFLHHDVWMAIFSHSLLRVTIIFMTLDLIANSLTPFLYNSIVSFFDFRKLWSPELIETMTMLDPSQIQLMLHPPQILPDVWWRYEAFVLTAHWPLIVGSIVLLVFYWRALLRTRELYADARVAQWQGDEQVLLDQLLQSQVTQAMQPPYEKKLKERIVSLATQLREVNILGLEKLWSWLDPHPSFQTRRECLTEPHKVYGSDVAIAMTAGVTVVLLNLTLGSLFLSRYLRGPNSGVPFIVGFSVLSLSLLPFLCQFPERHREYSRKIIRVVGLFTFIKVIPQYLAGLMLTAALMVDPSLMDQAAYTLVPGAGSNPPPTGIPLEFILDTFVIRPALLFTFVMPIVLFLWLRLDAWIKRQVMRWYSASIFVRHPARILWGITAILAMVLALLVLPILDALTVPSAHDLLDPLTYVGTLVAIGIFVGAIVIFVVGNQRCADRCPRCNSHIEGEYQLGNVCPVCNELFHPQLVIKPHPESLDLQTP